MLNRIKNNWNPFCDVKFICHVNVHDKSRIRFRDTALVALEDNPCRSITTA